MICFRNEDWWYAQHTDPKYNNQQMEGYVPRNYVALEDTLESQEYVIHRNHALGKWGLMHVP